MAIFRAATNHISRGKGHNVVAAAAYRAGEKLTDTNKLNPDATTYDYTKKHGVLAKNIVLPTALSAQGFSINRQELWSSVEEHETTTRSVKGSRLKQTARLAREWLLSLPSELSDEENEQLTAEFTQHLANELGVIGDYCIHKPTVANYKPKADYIESYDPSTDTVERTYVNEIKASEPDHRNIHAHIMFTTRKAGLTADGELSLGDKADSERSEKWRKDEGMVNGGDYIKQVRELWADMVNQKLTQHGIAPISHKSYKDLGLDIEPQHKQGKNASTLALYGFNPPIIGINNDIKKRNRAVIKSAANHYIAIRTETKGRSDPWIEEASKWLSRTAPTPFDTKRRAERLGEQSIIFDRLAERANNLTEQTAEILAETLIQKALKKYRDIKMYEPFIQYSDWSGRSGESRANPDPDPILEFNDRQRDIIDNMSEHLTGHDDGYLSDKVLKECLRIKVNERMLTLLTDPKREQLQYEQEEKGRIEQKNDNNRTLDIKPIEQKGSEQQQTTLTLPTPRRTHTPR